MILPSRVNVAPADMERPEDKCRAFKMLRNFIMADFDQVNNTFQVLRLTHFRFRQGAPFNISHDEDTLCAIDNLRRDTGSISGACGRMGKRLIALCSEDKELQLKKALESPGHPLLGSDAGEVAQTGKLGIPVVDSLDERVDVLIDFTAPAGTRARIAQCRALKTAMVIGTTGLTDDDMRIIREASKEIAIVQAPNMSVGINVLLDVVGGVARDLGEDYDIEIIEAHHNRKKDAPSGTARRLADEILQARGRSKKYRLVYGREGNVGKRPKGEIGIHSVRAGDIIGDHTVVFAGGNERIEIIHKAHSRDVFARGALRACKFIVGKSPKLYSMQDALKEI